jgi:aryl-alcohol dehydrogenase (NADP+)
MKYVRFGTSGLQVSKACLGCMTFGSPEWKAWVLDEEQSRPIIRQALELGINFFDTANMYSLGRSEEIVGKALREYAHRDDYVLATKVFFPMSDKPNNRGLSRKHILSSVDASLKRLGSDYIDLLVIHRFDPDTTIEETVDALDTVIRSGKVRYIGGSTMDAWQFMKMLGIQEKLGLSKFVSIQTHYNLLYREEEREMIPLCQSEGIAYTPWSPLARGVLLGSRQENTIRSKTDPLISRWYDRHEMEDAITAAVKVVANGRGVSPAQVAISWVANRPGVTLPIVGADKSHHLNEITAGLELKLTVDELATLEAPYQPRPVHGYI